MEKKTKVVLGLLGVAVIAAGSGVIISHFINNKPNSQKLIKKEMENLVPDKNPEEIIIPDDATEEQKAELQEEKIYWQFIKDFKEGAHSILHTDQVVAGIKDIYADSERLFVTVYLYDKDDKDKLIRKIQTFYISGNFENVSVEDLNNININNCDIHVGMAKLDVEDSAIKEAIEIIRKNGDILKNVDAYEVTSVNSTANFGLNVPTSFDVIIKCYESGKLPYFVDYSVQVRNIQDINENEVRNAYNTRNYGIFTQKYDQMGFDWQELNQKYKLNDFFGEDSKGNGQVVTQQTQAQATIAEFSNADGTFNTSKYIQHAQASLSSTKQAEKPTVNMSVECPNCCL